MRKYTIPRFAYVLLVLLLATLSFGYTYAYFSSYYDTHIGANMGVIGMEWWDSSINAKINNGNSSISVNAQTFTSGEFSQIIAPDVNDATKTRQSTLQIKNVNTDNGLPAPTVDVFCRISITGTYTPAGSTEVKNCGADWIQPAYKGTSSTAKLLTQTGNWVYDNGYYYLGTALNVDSLISVPANQYVIVADHLYLSPDADADIFGASVTITIRVDALQTTNKAYQTLWGVTW